MKINGNLDYIDLQETTNLIINSRGNKIISTSNISKGIALRTYDGESSVFYSRNGDQNIPSIKSLIDKYNLYEKFDFSSNHSKSLTVSPNFGEKIEHLINRLENIITYDLLIKQEKKEDIILDETGKDPITNVVELTTAEISIYIQKEETPFLIKRSVALNDKKDYELQVCEFIDKLIYEYISYIGYPFKIIVSQEFDLILPAGRGGIFIHETIGHALEADHYFSINSLLHNKMYKKIANDDFSVSDISTPCNIIHSKCADDGSELKNVVLIKDGVTEGVLSDRLTSKRFGIPNTGCGRSSSFLQPVIPRMRNTFLHNGSNNPEEIMKETKSGIYALDIGAGQVDICTGNFVFNIYSAYYIENGNPIALIPPFLFKGNILKSIKQIDMIGNDLEFQYGVCGKKGQLLPVSYGQPTIRLSKQKIER